MQNLSPRPAIIVVKSGGKAAETGRITRLRRFVLLVKNGGGSASELAHLLDKARMFCYTVVVHPPSKPQLIAHLQERTPHIVGFFR